MRSDMSRLIIEDGRRGDGGAKSCYDKITRPGEGFENFPARESMSRHRKQYCNSQGDRLNPLKRFLESRVGQRWSKVFSEICAVNDKRTLRGFHLLTHLFQYVHVDGTRERNYRYHDFMVENDVLYKVKQRHRSRAAAKPVEVIRLQDGWKYEKIDGIWYRIHVNAVVTKFPGKFNVRVYMAGTKHEHIYTNYVEGKTVTEYVQDAKLQCGKKELKRIRVILSSEDTAHGSNLV
jgi:hypothetical protein